MSDKPRRKVKIVINQRNRKADPRLLRKVANQFPEEDLEVHIDQSLSEESANAMLPDEQLETRAKGEIKERLDEKAKRVAEPGGAEPESRPEKKGLFNRALSMIKAGWYVTVHAITDAVVGRKE